MEYGFESFSRKSFSMKYCWTAISKANLIKSLRYRSIGGHLKWLPLSFRETLQKCFVPHIFHILQVKIESKISCNMVKSLFHSYIMVQPDSKKYSISLSYLQACALRVVFTLHLFDIYVTPFQSLSFEILQRNPEEKYYVILYVLPVRIFVFH